MTFIFYYEDGNNNLFNNNGTKVYDLMYGVLTHVTDSYLQSSKQSDSANNKKTFVRFAVSEPKS